MARKGKNRTGRRNKYKKQLKPIKYSSRYSIFKHKLLPIIQEAFDDEFMGTSGVIIEYPEIDMYNTIRILYYLDEIKDEKRYIKQLKNLFRSLQHKSEIAWWELLIYDDYLELSCN